MGAADQLLAARWNSAMAVSGGPDINNLEAAIKLITGIPFASTISVGLGMTAKCQFGLPVRCRGNSTPGSNGVRLRDITNSKEWLIQAIDGNLNLYYNNGSEDSATWEFHGRLPIGCICHVNRDSPQSVTSASVIVTWETAVVEDVSDMFVVGTYPTRVTVPEDGYYRITAYAYANVSGQTLNGYSYSAFKVNGSNIYESGRSNYWELGSSDPQLSFANEYYAELDEDDYIEWLLASEQSYSLTNFNMVVERIR